MTKEETFEQLLDSFPLLYYYIRLNPKLEKVPAIKTKGKFVEGKLIYLKARDFSTLWLIGLLAEREVGGCMQTLLCDLVEWKHPSNRDEPGKRFGEDVLDRLEVAGYISREKKHSVNRRSSLVELTQEGSKCLEQLREIRRENVARLLDLLELKEEQELDVFAERFNRIAKRAWRKIRKEAKNNKINLS